VPAMLTRMTGGEVASSTIFVRIAEFLGLAAGEVNNPCLASTCDVGSGPIRKHSLEARTCNWIAPQPFPITTSTLPSSSSSGPPAG